MTPPNSTPRTFRYGPGHRHSLAQYRSRRISKALGSPHEGSRDLQRLRDTYREQHGVGEPYRGPIKHSEHNAKRIADAFDAMPDNPHDPATKASYNALKKETLAQYHHIVINGYKFTPSDKTSEIYHDSGDVVHDLTHNKHLYYHPTLSGFGSGDVQDFAHHPLMEEAPLRIDGHPTTYNCLFRAVHDAFGHGAEGNSFGPKGEEQAWAAHRAMFSPEARPAMTTETRGQNSWVNYGKHLRRDDGTIPKKGETGYVHPVDRPYADQKTGILPAEFHDHPDLR